MKTKKKNTSLNENTIVTVGILNQAVDAVLRGMGDIVNKMTDKFNKIDMKLDEISKDMQEVKNNISWLKDDFDGIKADISNSPSRKEFNDLKNEVVNYLHN